MRRRSFACLLGGTTAALAAPAIAAQAPPGYPDRPVRLMVPFPPGGGTDTWARLCAEAMSPELGQPIVIENRSGAGGLLGTELAARAAPDGYTLLFAITTHVQTPVVLRRWPYQPVDDFAFIGRQGTTAVVWMVGPSVPAEVRDMAAFLDWAKGRDLAIGAYSPGSTGHAFALMMEREKGLRFTHAMYRGEAPMVQDMVGGQIHGGFHSMTAAGAMVQAGRLRALAASGDERVPSLPNVPLMKEVGFSDRFSFTGFSGLLAPARTPAPILARLADAFAKAQRKPELQRRLLQLDTVPSFLPPDAFRANVAGLLRDWTAIADDLNLVVEG